LTQQIKNNEDLITFAKILSHQTDFQEVLRLVAHKSAQFLKADLALILMINPDTRETIKTVMKDGKSTEQLEFRKIHIHIGGWIINYKKSFLSKNIYRDKRFTKGSFDGLNLKSVLGVPLIVEGIIIGALILLYQKPSEYVNGDAIDFLEKIATISAPFLRNVQKIRQYFGSTMSVSSLLLKYKNVGLLGKSQRFIELLQAIESAIKCDVRVMLDGKTGTGKELIAKSIHQFSSRADQPFIAIDCGAIPDNLIESELFGYKRGAFTGASSDRQGLFLNANGGSLFMDEINNLPFDLQSKLLRVLQEEEIRPIGSDMPLKIDIRIISASSVPLKAMVEDHKFREDLFYRLHVYPIYVPGLCEREDDIPILALHFLLKYAKEQKKMAHHFHEEVIDFMKHHDWKGNIRELENYIERVVTVTPPNALIIDPEFFPSDLMTELENFRLNNKSQIRSKSIKEQLNQYEAELIRKTLVNCNWNKSEVARILKTSESNIRYKMSHLKIRRD